MLEHFGVSEENWREAGKQDRNFLESESPLFVGRVVAALAVDPNILARTGQLFSSWEAAREYGITDVDGRRPDWGALDIDFDRGFRRSDSSALIAFSASATVVVGALTAVTSRSSRAAFIAGRTAGVGSVYGPSR